MPNDLSVREKSILLFAGCYEKEDTPDSFYSSCDPVCPVKHLFETDCMTLMTSLEDKGYVCLVPVYEGCSYPMRYDWTNKGRDAVADLFGAYLFCRCIYQMGSYFPMFEECDGDLAKFIERMEAMLPDDKTGFPLHHALDILDVCRPTAEKDFIKFVNKKHAPSRDDANLLMPYRTKEHGRYYKMAYGDD